MPKNPWSGITRTVTGRRLLIQVSLVVFATIGGYLIAAFWFFPAPLFSESVAVPRVIELDVAQAQERLIAAGLRVHREGEMAHPRLPSGTVIWQDPPPYSEIGSGAQVQLMISSGPPELAIPDVEGLDAALAMKVLTAAGLNMRGVDSVSNAAPKGTALATRPVAGVARSPTEPITLVVSSGPANNMIPDVSNMTIQDARVRLMDAGFNIGRITLERSEGLPAGKVIRQRPAAGGLSAKDSRVDLVVSGDPE